MNLKPLLITLISLLFFATPASSAILLYDPCEEEPNKTTEWHPIIDYYSTPCSTPTITYSTEQARSGLGSYKFVAEACVKHNMLNPYNHSIENFQFDEEYWVGFSIYVPEGYAYDTHYPYMLYVQWHGQPDNLGVCDTWRNPMIAMQDYSATAFKAVYRYQSIECCLVPTDTCHSYDINQWIQPLASRISGSWNDIVYHVKFSMTSGILEQWVNGIKVLSYAGPLGYNDDTGPYFTFGTYQGSGGQNLIFYYDELRFGDENSSYSEVAPTSSPAPSAPTVTASQPTDVTSISATGQGTLVNVGSDNVTKRGFCWNSTGSPTIADSHIEETGDFGESDIGTFTGSITGLNPSQHYYLKVYAYNTAGYGYSSDIEFYAQSSTSEISKAGWSLKYADSEEVTGEDGNATNAFDDNESTIWHTEWYESDPVCPHEIQINLGASYDLTGFRYMPRQDGGDNGRINGYEFYTSTDGTNWGSAVADGNFTDTAYEQEDLFTTVTGQYVKLIATSSHDNDAWTTVAEIDVLGGTVDSGTNMPSRTYGIGLSGCSLK